MKNCFFLFFVLILCISKQIYAQIDTVCVGVIKTYSIDAGVAWSSYLWGIYKSQGTILTGQNSNKITIHWNNYAGMDSIFVVETNSSNCGGDTSTLKILKVSLPEAAFGDSLYCFGSDIKINLNGFAPYSIEYLQNNRIMYKEGIIGEYVIINGEVGICMINKISDKFGTKVYSENEKTCRVLDSFEKINIFRK